ncbi:hypothetical protein ACF0H5_024077 [Mactra antiquata]
MLICRKAWMIDSVRKLYQISAWTTLRIMAALWTLFRKLVSSLTPKRNIALLLTYFYIFTLVLLVILYHETDSKLEEKETHKRPFLKRSSLTNNEKERNGKKPEVDKTVVDKSKDAVVDKNDAKTIQKDKQSENGKKLEQNNQINANRKLQDAGKKKKAIDPLARTGRVYKTAEKIANFKFNNTPPVKDAVWQNIMEDGTFMIFSAVLMNNSGAEPFIRGLAMNGNYYMPRFYCEYQYQDNSIVTVKGLKPWMLPDHHEKEYKTQFLNCPLPDDRVPKHVSYIPVKEPVRLHKLPVIFNPQEERLFTVCLSPMFFNYSVEQALVQWFEANKILGADMFYVYNYSTYGRTDEILNHYVKEGWVKIIQWRLPEHTDLHYYGQVAMMNDCLFRNYKVSRYIANMDLDELIVPRKGVLTWMDMMKALPVDKCEFNFRSSIMASESKEVFEGKQKARELGLNFLLTVSRREYVFDKNVRSKFIVNTTCIDTVGIHFCWKYQNGTADTQRYHVPPRDGLVLHFRSEPVAKNGREIEEKAVYKYHVELIDNARMRWKKINAEKQNKKS